MTLSKIVPSKVKRFVKESRLYVRHKSSALNVYHCCVQKTASKWLEIIFSDPRTYKYSGLVHYNYAKTFYGDFDIVQGKPTSFTDMLPQNVIVSPIYIDFQNYLTIPKPERFKTFFIARDPRDVVVSWYFSVRYSHRPVGRISEHREVLNDMPVSEGLLYSIDYLDEYGLFGALRSWADAPAKDPNVLLIRFEDMTAPSNLEVFRKVFSHCDIQMPDKVLSQLLDDHSFEKLSGRKRGEEDQHTHYRKGVAGDWQNHFDDAITERFKAVTNNLVVQLAYEKDSAW